MQKYLKAKYGAIRYNPQDKAKREKLKVDRLEENGNTQV